MRNRICRAIVVVGVVWLTTSMAWGAALPPPKTSKRSIPKLSAPPPAVYFHNRRYTGPLVNLQGEWYAPVERIAVLLKVSLDRAGRQVFLSSLTDDEKGRPARPDAPHPDGREALVYVNGLPLKHGVMLQGETVLVSLRLLAEKLKLAYIYNADTQILDLVRTITYGPQDLPTGPAPGGKSPPTPEAASIPQPDARKPETTSPDAGSDPTLQRTGGGTWNALDGSERDPVILENLNFRQEPFSTTGEVRYSGTVRNIGQKSVERVTVTCQFLDQDRRVLHGETKEVGTLLPGTTKDVLFYWVNASGLNVLAQIRLDWEGRARK